MTDFVLPTKGTSEMSKDDQGALLVNQATAIIISSYLDHAAKVNAVNPQVSLQYRHSELIALINDVQDALKSF